MAEQRSGYRQVGKEMLSMLASPDSSRAEVSLFTLQTYLIVVCGNLED